MEIHYDAARRSLALACEPGAFREFRELARAHLADFPEIDLDTVMEIRLTDVQRFTAWRDAPRKRRKDLVFGLLLAALLILAATGAASIVAKLLGR